MKKEESNGVCNINLCLNVSWTISGAQYCNFPEGRPARGHLSLMKAPLDGVFFYPPSNRLSQFLCYNLHLEACLPLTAVFRSAPWTEISAVPTSNRKAWVWLFSPLSGLVSLCLEWTHWFLAVSDSCGENSMVWCMWYTKHSVCPVWVTW